MTEKRICPECKREVIVKTGYKFPILVCKKCKCRMYKNKTPEGLLKALRNNPAIEYAEPRREI